MLFPIRIVANSFLGLSSNSLISVDEVLSSFSKFSVSLGPKEKKAFSDAEKNIEPTSNNNMMRPMMIMPYENGLTDICNTTANTAWYGSSGDILILLSSKI
jgi:hypothetical protein